MTTASNLSGVQIITIGKQGPPGPPAASVADVATAAAISDALLADGTTLYVVSLRRWFALDKTSVLALVADVTLATLSSVGGTLPGRWLLTSQVFGEAPGGVPLATVANSVLQRATDASPAYFAPLTQDQILSAYTVALSLTGASLVVLGSTVATPAFTAAYARTAAAAVLTDTDATTPLSVIGTPTTFASTGSFTKSTFGQSVTFTLTANEAGSPSKTSTATVTWAQLVYYGAAVPGTLNEGFIQALASSSLATSRARTFTATAGATQRIYYAFRSAFGTPTFTVGGFTGGFTLAASAVPVTNAAGVTENYDIWASDNLNLGVTTVGVS